MIDFSNIEYLKTGNPKQIEAYKTLKQNKVMEALFEFDPSRIQSPALVKKDYMVILQKCAGKFASIREENVPFFCQGLLLMSIKSDLRCEAASKRVWWVYFSEFITEGPNESTARLPCERHDWERDAWLFEGCSSRFRTYTDNVAIKGNSGCSGLPWGW